MDFTHERKPPQKKMQPRAGLQNDLPMATRDAMEAQDGGKNFLSPIGIQIDEIQKEHRLLKLDADATRNRVTNLLERMEPRVALIEEILLEAGMLTRNDKGQLVKTIPQESSLSKPQRKPRGNHAAKR